MTKPSLLALAFLFLLHPHSCFAADGIAFSYELLSGSAILDQNKANFVLGPGTKMSIIFSWANTNDDIRWTNSNKHVIKDKFVQMHLGSLGILKLEISSLSKGRSELLVEASGNIKALYFQVE